jgi:hypothetical protein
VISLERAAVTRRIVWNQNVFNHKHSYCTLVIIYTVLLFLNIHYLIYFGSEQENNDQLINNRTERKVLTMCSSNLNRSTTAPYDHFLKFYFSWMDFIINSFIPFIIILIANASVMYSVCKSRILMKQLGIRQTRSPRDTQLAYILFVSTFLFLLLTFPLRVFSVIEPHLSYEKKYLILLDGISRFLLYIDHGCGFYLYTFTGELFRREIKKFLNEFLYLIFRRRFFNWSVVESRRHSEVSGSNGGIPSHTIFSQPQQQLGNLYLQDSINSTAGVKSSLYSLQPQKPRYHVSYHQCAYAKQHPNNPLSRVKQCTCREQSNYSPTNQTGLVKRHSSSCFESQYKTEPTVSLIPLTKLITEDLDRKSDII